MSLDLAFQDYGEGPPLVILHGLFGSGRNWTGIARRLAEAWHVYALDLRNHGDSPWAETMDYPAMAGDVSAFLDRQGLDRVALLGHSMGGKTAMALALAQPERIGSLTVVDIAPVAYSQTHQGYVEALQALDLGGITRRAEADAALQASIPEAGIRAFLLQNLVARDGGFAWRFNLAALGAGMAEISGFPEAPGQGAYDGRTFFLGGGLSDYITAEHQGAIARLFPRAAVETVAGAGHWVHAEAPERFLEALQAFLTETVDPRGHAGSERGVDDDVQRT